MPSPSLPVPKKAAAPASSPKAPRVIAREQLAHVGYDTGVFPTMLGTPGPRLVLAVLDSLPAFSELEVDEVRDVDDEALAGIGVVRPPSVWLVTPAGACPATLKDGYVGYYAEGPEAYEVGFHLVPCAADFGPLAVVAELPPHELRWVPAEVELDDRVEPSAWEHPLRDAFVELGLGTHQDDAGTPAPARWARIMAVPGTPLRQLFAIDHWPAEEACDEHEVVSSGLVMMGDEGPAWLLPPEDLGWGGGEAQLVGALVQGEVPLVVVQRVRFQAGLGLRDRDGGYQWFELDTGRYHDEDVAYAGYSVRQYCGP
ncbi:hypothetical protein [Paraliomyxa miuraensis]|uniref:hypothetical protein n=1 Tax=Paraliomyxa miuraensis TaxID=376150 RepID=UPI002256B481|nr:hypothetical protein [Paraliomyxa miuraensis]MCX4243251.1 hypothetical protein [Paraliomyxa miuraensis]